MEPANVVPVLSVAGIPVPKDVTYAAEILAAANEYVAEAHNADRLVLFDAVVSQKVKPADLGRVLRERTLDRLAQSNPAGDMHAIRRGVNELTSRAVAEHADEWVAVMRPRFDAAVAVLRGSLVAATVTGMTNVNETRPFVSVDSPERTVALRELEVVRAVRRLVGQAGYGDDSTESGAWWTRPRNRQEMVNANQALLGADGFVILAELGMPLVINTPAEVGDVLALAAKSQPRDLLANVGSA